MKTQYLAKDKIASLPRTAGVYFFENKKGNILYIGKAGKIKDRIQNHFSQPNYRDELFIDETARIGWQETGSEIEALILEAKLIKEFQPKFNVLWRDDKKYFYVKISESENQCPFISITHQPNHDKESKYIGPFTDGSSLKKTLRILRRVFPFYTAKKHPNNFCGWCHLNLCPGPSPDPEKCKCDVKKLVSFLKTGKKSPLKTIEKEMKRSSKARDFERAADLRNQLFSLRNILSHARIFSDSNVSQRDETGLLDIQNLLKLEKIPERIEAFDISNIQGQKATASMAVLSGGAPEKNQYRKFKIMAAGPNDTRMIEEAVSRRLNHSEWPFPDLLIVDGGRGQISAAFSALKKAKKENIPLAGLAKGKNELIFFPKKNTGTIVFPLKSIPKDGRLLLLRIRDEAHRFAISYHRVLRKKEISDYPLRQAGS